MARSRGSGLGLEASARLASQAAFFLHVFDGDVQTARTYLEGRARGHTQAAYAWAMMVGKRLATARERAESVGPRTTYNTLFRGTKGISPGFDVHIHVTVTLRNGSTIHLTRVLRDRVGGDSVKAGLDEAEAWARRGRPGGTQRRCKHYSGSAVASVEASIVAIIPASGAP